MSEERPSAGPGPVRRHAILLVALACATVTIVGVWMRPWFGPKAIWAMSVRASHVVVAPGLPVAVPTRDGFLVIASSGEARGVELLPDILIEDARVTEHGSLRVLYYAGLNAPTSRLHLAEFAGGSRPRFDVALENLRDNTCGTGRLMPLLSISGKSTWVVDQGATTIIARHDARGARQAVAKPCCDDCSCHVSNIWAHPKGLIAHTATYQSPPAGVFGAQGTWRSAVAWYDLAGNEVARVPFARDVRNARPAVDAQGRLVALIRETPSPCAGPTPSLVALDRGQCAWTRSLDALFTHPNVEAFQIAATNSYLYVASSGQDRRLPFFWRWQEPTTSVHVQRLGYDGEPLGQRTFGPERLRSVGRSWFSAITDERLVVISNTTPYPGQEQALSRQAKGMSDYVVQAFDF